MPDGFFELYYGLNLDKKCPVAYAIHRYSRDYTFAEVRDEFSGQLAGSSEAKAAWDQFDLLDGIVLFSGRNTDSGKSAFVVMTDQVAEKPFVKFGAVLAYAARRVDNLIIGHPELNEIPRNDPILSDTQLKVLRLQIDHPELSHKDMADKLGMSVKTLLSHHKRIAKKNNVSSFASAVAISLK